MPVYTATPVLWWKPATGADSYFLTVSVRNGSVSKVYEGKVEGEVFQFGKVTGRSFALPVGLTRGTYRWSMRASNSAGDSLSSSALYFRVEAEPTKSEINAMLEDAARAYDLPPMLLKAIAWRESEWLHYEDNKLHTNASNSDGSIDIGIMQINMSNDLQSEKYVRLSDIRANIKEGARLLSGKWASFQPGTRKGGPTDRMACVPAGGGQARATRAPPVGCSR